MSRIRPVLYNMLTIRVVHSNLMRLLETYTAAGIILCSVETIDELTAILSVDRKYMPLLRSITEKQHGEISVLRLEGLYWKIRNCLRRPILILGIFLLLILTITVPRVIFFVGVQGNSQVSDIQILDAAERAGIKFGTLRRSIRSEQIKNQLLDMLPQLQWVGITTEGCVATISVREIHPDPNAQLAPLCGIVAARDGVIQNMHITKGNALCVPGQAVKAGELLVSAYTDCGLNLRANGAEGEIYALTVRENKTALPVPYCVQGEKSGEILRCSLIVGKKRINFYKDSGICDTGCDKMYKEYYVTLPGGFRLPIAFTIERLSFFENSTVTVLGLEATNALRQWSEDYLRKEMVAGKILSAQTYTQQNEKLFVITGIYRCLEMIGRLQQEEIVGNYGESN